MKVSVLIPVYNEHRTLNQVLERVWRAPLPEGCTKEVVVVNDGSTDGTARLLEEHRRPGLIVGHHSSCNLGKGTAIRTAITLATGDVMIVQDGDLEYDPEDYAAILDPIVRGDADVVYGSRFLKNPKPMAGKYWLANRVLTWLTNFLYRARLTDEATAYKAFRSPVLRSVQLNCRRFEFCPEITAKILRLGCAVREVPIHYNPRGIAEGKKIRFVDGIESVWTLVRYRLASLRSIVRPDIQTRVSCETGVYVTPWLWKIVTKYRKEFLPLVTAGSSTVENLLRPLNLDNLSHRASQNVSTAHGSTGTHSGAASARD